MCVCVCVCVCVKLHITEAINGHKNNTEYIKRFRKLSENPRVLWPLDKHINNTALCLDYQQGYVDRNTADPGFTQKPTLTV